MSDETTAGGKDAPPSRFAGGCVAVVLAAVALLILKTTVTAAPYVAYVVVGILCTIGWQKAWARWGKHAGRAAEGEPEAAQPDVGEALRRLVGDDNGVLLTRLRDELKLPDTKVVKHLLDADDIPWKAVRTSHGNGPGVHKTSIPAAPSPVAEAHVDGCCCRSGDNGNSDNADEEGLRVEPIGQGGTVLYRRRRGSSRRHH